MKDFIELIKENPLFAFIGCIALLLDIVAVVLIIIAVCTGDAKYNALSCSFSLAACTLCPIMMLISIS